MFCFVAAMREWPMPLAGDRQRQHDASTPVPEDHLAAESAADVTLTPRQFADKLILDVRNNGLTGSFTAEVIFIFRSNGDGAPDTTPGWAVPWAANGKAGLSTDAAEIPHGQQRTLDLARYDPAAVQASRLGYPSGPHWLFSSMPDPVGFSYWPPIASGRDLSGRRFVVTLRIFRSSPPGWSDYTFGVGVSGSAIVCEPLPLRVEVIETDWRDRELRDFIVAVRLQVQNNSGKTIRLSPVHWMQVAVPGVVPAEPTDLPAIRAAVSAEQARRTPSLYDRMEIAAGEVVRGWIVYGVGRSATGGKPQAFLVIRDEEGNMYPGRRRRCDDSALIRAEVLSGSGWRARILTHREASEIAGDLPAPDGRRRAGVLLAVARWRRRRRLFQTTKTEERVMMAAAISG